MGCEHVKEKKNLGNEFLFVYAGICLWQRNLNVKRNEKGWYSKSVFNKIESLCPGFLIRGRKSDENTAAIVLLRRTTFSLCRKGLREPTIFWNRYFPLPSTLVLPTPIHLPIRRIINPQGFHLFDYTNSYNIIKRCNFPFYARKGHKRHLFSGHLHVAPLLFRQHRFLSF